VRRDIEFDQAGLIFSPFSEVVGKYTEELRKLGLKLLELFCEGLGLNTEYFCGELSQNPVVLSHYYPPCPEPSLTLGTSIHKDPNLLTILLQQVGINALQVFKDGEWFGVEPIPNAFVVNIGIVFEVNFFHIAIFFGFKESYYNTLSYYIDPYNSLCGTIIDGLLLISLL